MVAISLMKIMLVVILYFKVASLAITTFKKNKGTISNITSNQIELVIKV